MSDDHQEDPADWKFLRQRNGMKHRDNCTDGFRKLAISEIHHILCVHACSDARMPDDAKAVDFIHKCMAITTWDINAGHNNIGLPKKWAYDTHLNAQASIIAARTKAVVGKAALDKRAKKDDWDGLPCHQVDHPKYLEVVEDWVVENIWKVLAKEKADENCTAVNPRDIAKLFENGTDKHKTFLTDRGKENGGTRHCLAYAVANVSQLGEQAKGEVAVWDLVKTEKSKGWSCSKSNWFVPFSMDPGTPRERTPPNVPAGGGIRRANLLNLKIT